MGAPEVYIDGVSALVYSPVAELEWSEKADGGCDLASFALPGLATVPGLNPFGVGARIDVALNGDPIWSGQLDEQEDRLSVTFSARGGFYQGDSTIALDVGPVQSPISTPSVAVTAAIARGALDWAYRGGLSESAYVTPDDAEEPTEGTGEVTPKVSTIYTVADLLDAAEGALGKRWGVGPGREVYSRTDPTEPTWMLTPGTALPGTADDDYVSHLLGAFLDTTGALDYVFAGAPGVPDRPGRRKEQPVDLTPLGKITAARARSILDGKLALTGPRSGYTGAVEATPLTLTSIGGTRSDVRLVQAGDLCRAQGVITGDPDINPSGYLDFVLGEVSHKASEDTVRITPVGLVPRSLSDLLSVSAPKSAA